MGTRLDLQTLLESIPGVTEVYFQPPASISMTYPCIVYVWSDISPDYANNKPYRLSNEYTLTIMDRNPDSVIVSEVASLQSSRFIRSYKADGLNHYVFRLIF